MTILKSAGSGYFQSPFTMAQVLGRWQCAPDIAGNFAYGAWVHLAPIVLSAESRWIDLHFAPTTSVEIFHVQMAYGSAGNETVWLPTQGVSAFDGIVLNWTGAGLTYQFPYNITFPLDIPGATDISFRCGCLQANNPQPNLDIDIVLWS